MAWAYQSLPGQPPPYYQRQDYTYQKFPNQIVYEAAPFVQPDQIPLTPVSYAPSAPFIPKSLTVPHKTRWVDIPTTLLLFVVWGSLFCSGMVLLYVTYLATEATSDDGTIVTSTEIAGTVALAAFPILFATISNEILIDRCQRRINYSALGKQAVYLSNEELARNLRAANFEWLNFFKRTFLCRLNRQDIRSLASYGLLRWGTAISIASVQLCVSWTPTEVDGDVVRYSASKRYAWVVGPVFLHACSLFGAMLIWLMPPWRFFSGRFDDFGLLTKYQPYLERVRGGSIAKYDAVASYLDPHTQGPKSLRRKNEPGLQLAAKLKGIWFGLVCMNVPPALAWAFFNFYAKPNEVLTVRLYRFSLHFVFLAQNIFYLLALDFVVWNLSLEGFCRRDGARLNRNLRHLSSSSGSMLFLKAVKQRRPIRAALFFWLFWLQACMIRLLTVFYAFCVTVFSYGGDTDRAQFYDPEFWIGWLLITGFVTLPVFLIWLFTKFEAPMCEQDGWRWAKLAQNALTEPGYYGVRNGEAVWGREVESFYKHKGMELF